MHNALAALGNPQVKLPPIIHVAGTNGKGSAIAFLCAIAEAAGLRVHAFTKPHLLHLRERFRVSGAIANDDALIGAAERVAVIDAELTQFDAQVAAAALLFAATPAELVLLETGMGGREDSTNVIEHPALSLITPIGLDHQDALGPTLTDIARHKAGIIKAGAPVIVARQPDEARAVIEQEAARLGAPLYQQGADWDAHLSGGRLVVQTETRALDLPAPALFGAHQADNAGLAVAAMLFWNDARISEAAFARGMETARWPGRMQALTRGPLAALAGNAELWVDGGHNEPAAVALARTLADLQRRTPRPVVLIVGMRARKDHAAFIRHLSPHAARLIAIPLSEESVAPDELASVARASGLKVETAPTLTAAIKNAAQFPAPRILICGSLLLAAEALAAESD